MRGIRSGIRQYVRIAISTVDYHLAGRLKCQVRTERKQRERKVNKVGKGPCSHSSDVEG